MQKLFKLRRLAVIWLAMVTGYALGSFGYTWPLIALSLFVMLWLMIYDFTQFDMVKKNDN